MNDLSVQQRLPSDWPPAEAWYLLRSYLYLAAHGFGSGTLPVSCRLGILGHFLLCLAMNFVPVLSTVPGTRYAFSKYLWDHTKSAYGIY